MKNQELHEIYELLKKVDFLYKLSVVEINTLINKFEKMVLKKGTVIIRQGGMGDTFFLVSEGKLAVWVKRLDGKKVFVRHLGKGSYFGEMSLLTGDKRTATVITEEKTVLFKLSKKDFGYTLSKNPAIIESISQVVSMRRDQLAREGEKTVKRESLGKRILVFFNLD